jgi:hypothetical protein
MGAHLHHTISEALQGIGYRVEVLVHVMLFEML